jgi:hypothetical protein
MDHPVLALAHCVRALGLPVCDPLQARLAGFPQRIRVDETFIVVRDLFTRVAQVLHICLGGGGVWRARGQRVLVTGEFQTDQITCWRGS